MERDFTMSENIQEDAERREDVYYYATAQTGNSQIAENVAQYVFESISGQVQHGSETEIESFCSHVMTTACTVLIDKVRAKSWAEGDGRTVEQLQEQDSKVETADEARPEVSRMLEKILAVGGTQIVKRLAEHDANIKAAVCTKPEIGSLVDAHYVPLLLSALALDDAEFDAEYPGGSQVSSEQRKALAGAIQEHCKDEKDEGCPRCSLKFSRDMEWDEHVDEVFSKSKHRRRLYV